MFNFYTELNVLFSFLFYVFLFFKCSVRSLEDILTLLLYYVINRKDINDVTYCY